MTTSPATKRAGRSDPNRRQFQVRLALLVALGIFAQEAVWNFHDSQTPATLNAFISSAGIIGLIMGLDNLLGIFVQPLVGHLSDRTRSKWGRRTPYIAIGAPIAALLFVLIPYAPTFPILIAVIVLFSFTANTFKPLTEALIADNQAAQHRSKGNAFGRFASGIAVIVAALLSALIVEDDDPGSVQLAYLISAVIMVVCFAFVLVTLKEPKTAAYRGVLTEDAVTPGKRPGLGATIKDIFTSKDRSRIFAILTVIVVWGTWSGVRSLLTIYGTNHLGLDRGDAGAFTIFGAVAFLVCVVPVAIISDRFGRRLMMRLGVVVLIIGALIGFIFNDSEVATIVAITVVGIGFTGFGVNATVVLWNLAPSRRLLGVYTGTLRAGAGDRLLPRPGGDRNGWST